MFEVVDATRADVVGVGVVGIVIPVQEATNSFPSLTLICEECWISVRRRAYLPVALVIGFSETLKTNDCIKSFFILFR